MWYQHITVRTLEGDMNVNFDKLEIRNIKDTETRANYILLSGKLDNGYGVYIRIPIFFVIY